RFAVARGLDAGDLDRLAGLVAQQQLAVRPERRVNDVVDLAERVEHHLLSAVAALGDERLEIEQPAGDMGYQRALAVGVGRRDGIESRRIKYMAAGTIARQHRGGQPQK